MPPKQHCSHCAYGDAKPNEPQITNQVRACIYLLLTVGRSAGHY